MPRRLIIFCFLSSFLIAITSISAIFAVDAPSFLKVVVLVNNTGGGTAQPSDFRITVGFVGTADPWLFDGSSKGVISNVVQGTHSVSISKGLEIENIPYSFAFSGDCMGQDLSSSKVAISPGDKKTCIIIATYPNFE